MLLIGLLKPVEFGSTEAPVIERGNVVAGAMIEAAGPRVNEPDTRDRVAAGAVVRRAGPGIDGRNIVGRGAAGNDGRVRPRGSAWTVWVRRATAIMLNQ